MYQMFFQELKICVPLLH